MSLLDILIPLVWSSGLLAIGSSLHRGVDGDFHPEYFFPLAGFLGLFIYILGLLSALHDIIFICLTLIFLLATAWWILKSKMHSWVIDHFKRHPVTFLIVLVFLIWFGLASLSYPVTIDALNVHLGLPELYAKSGQISFFPGNPFSASPRTMEMILTSFYSLRLERAAPFFVMLIAAIFVFSIWTRARDFGGNGAIATWLLLSVPVFVSLVPAAKNDFLLWGLTFFAGLRYLEFEKSSRQSDLLWVGAAAGMAAGVKAIGLALAGVFGAVIIYNMLLGRQRIRHVLLFTAIFLLLSFPWYLYSWIVTGNPVYPFFDSLFHSPYTSTALEAFNKNLAFKTVDRNLLRLLLSPFDLVFSPDRYDGRLGFAILLFPALLIFVKRIPYGVKLALGFSLAYFPIWFFGFPYARFLLPMLPFLAIAGSFFLKSAIDRGGWIKPVLVLSLAAAVLLPLPSAVRDTSARVVSVLRGTPKNEFLADYRTLDSSDPHHAKSMPLLAYINCWEFLNRNCPPDARVGILSSYWTRADAYYLERGFVFLNPSEQREYDFLSLRNPAEIKKALAALGITYVIIDSLVISQYSDGSPWSRFAGFAAFRDGVKALQLFCGQFGELVFDDGWYRAYKL
jgi:hypothetical protein